MITKGEGSLGRIYERLRKRSYRLGATMTHRAYVTGVKDALQAVDKNLTGIYHERKLRGRNDISEMETLVSGR